MVRGTEKVFVYGTLRRGYRLHRYLAKGPVRYIGEGTVEGKLYDLGEFPGAVPSSAADARISGEVYELLDAKQQFQKLDEVEEYDPEQPQRSLFVRRKASVRLRDGRRTTAWVYFLPRRPEKARLLSGGDFAEGRRLHG